MGTYKTEDKLKIQTLQKQAR